MDQAKVLGEARATKRNWLALGAVAGPSLFTAAWFVLGFISPGFTIWGQEVAPYSAIIHPVSGLGLGVTAPFMNGAFVLSGALILCGIVATFRSIPELGRAKGWLCVALLGLSPVGAMLDGVFTLEMMMPHLIGFLLAAASPVLSFLCVGLLLRNVPGWGGIAKVLLVASPLTLVLVVVFFLTFDASGAGNAHGVSGLVQRVLITEVLACLAAIGWRGFQAG